MADKVSKEKRSKMMSAVKAKDSKIELTLRKALWAQGFRYRKHYKKLPGTPDIVFPNAKIAVFCDSEFWHGKDWEKRKLDHKSNQEFWISKIETNMQRDKRVDAQLTDLGWSVLRFWGKDIMKDVARIVSAINSELNKRKKL